MRCNLPGERGHLETSGFLSCLTLEAFSRFPSVLPSARFVALRFCSFLLVLQWAESEGMYSSERDSGYWLS